MVEVIDTARDNLDTDKMQQKAGMVDDEASSDSDSSDSSTSNDIPDGSADDKQGPLDRIRDYRRRDKALHRQHRGIMQWKVRTGRACVVLGTGRVNGLLTWRQVPRTARWMKHKFERVGDGVTGLFDRHSKQAGVETEV